MRIVLIAAVFIVTCVVVSSGHDGKHNEWSQVQMSQENGQIENKQHVRSKRAVGTGNNIGGANANDDTLVATTPSAVSNEILYSESESNSKYAISVKPVVNGVTSPVNTSSVNNATYAPKEVNATNETSNADQTTIQTVINSQDATQSNEQAAPTIDTFESLANTPPVYTNNNNRSERDQITSTVKHAASNAGSDISATTSAPSRELIGTNVTKNGTDTVNDDVVSYNNLTESVNETVNESVTTALLNDINTPLPESSVKTETEATSKPIVNAVTTTDKSNTSESDAVETTTNIMLHVGISEEILLETTTIAFVSDTDMVSGNDSANSSASATNATRENAVIDNDNQTVNATNEETFEEAAEPEPVEEVNNVTDSGSNNVTNATGVDPTSNSTDNAANSTDAVDTGNVTNPVLETTSKASTKNLAGMFSTHNETSNLYPNGIPICIQHKSKVYKSSSDAAQFASVW